MDEVQQWLAEENPNFDKGFSLFSKFSKNQSLISYIGRRRDMAMLRYNLDKMCSIPFQNRTYRQGSSIAPPPAHVVIVDERKVNRDDLPEQMRALYDSNVSDYKEMRALHEKMKQANSDAGRAEFREKITKLNTKIKRRWEIIDSGKLPSEQNSKINSARAYLSKMLKKEELTEAQRSLMKEKYELIKSSGESLKPETIKKLQERGF